MKLIDAKAAASMVRDNATIAISGGGYRVEPESLIEAVSDRYVAENSPSDLTVIAVAMVERARGGKGGKDTGLNRLAKPGLMKRIFVSSFSRSSEHELNVGIRENHFATYNFPMGSIVQWLRAIASGRPGLATPVGLGTFVDPAVEGGRVNDAATPYSRIVDVDGHKMIYYPSLRIDVALVKASAADERGNLYFDREAFNHGVLDVAFAAHNSGGIVLAEVNRIVKAGEIHPRMALIPGAIVTAVVVQPEPWEDEQDPVITGATREELAPPVPRNLPRDVIARTAVSLLAEGDMVNLGAGIPMYDVPEAARMIGRDDIYFTVEQGPMGGWPKVGGASRNLELVLEQQEVFHFYEGGGPDVSILSFGQVDQYGNVNVSRFSGMLPGCGGFINIVHGIKTLMFCGTLTTGGLEEEISTDGVTVKTEGRIQRFVENVEQVTFNARQAFAAGKSVTYLTERGIFALTETGLHLTHIAPGIDLEKHILSQIPFKITVAENLKLMDKSLFEPAA
ncbi:malonate decarboxylase subunit alpha [Aureimonas fodinaquatilis]|nr:malonate decarboxylase subunit alpha [Aureimonas fodinaquatilis]